jgi:hypothetical protein
VPIHQLRATSARPHSDHLVRLKESHGAYEALPLLAGHHQGLTGPAPWRTELLATQAPHVFPMPGDVEPLLDALFTALERLFGVARTEEDDLRVAVFAAFGVTAIHPFDNANGRAAFDFSRLLLMHRWALTAPPFELPPDGHQRLGVFLREHDEPSSSPDPRALLALATRLRTRVITARLDDLEHTPLERVVVALKHLLR